MSDRLAFFGWFLCGDHMDLPEGVSLTVQPVQFLPAQWGTGSTPIVQAGGGSVRVSVTSHMWRGKYGSETVAEFRGRTLDFITNMREAAGFSPSNSYAQAKDLCIINDSSTDATTLAAGASSGTSVTLTATADIGLVTGDYVLIVDEANRHWDVAEVTSGSFPDFVVDSLDYTYTSGAVFGKVHWYLPAAYMQQMPEIGGKQPGDVNAAIDLQFVFESAEDPVHNL